MKKIKINTYVTSEKIIKPHLICSEILKYKDQDILISIEHEGWDLVANGVENLIKEICDFNCIPYKKIKFMSSNVNPNLTFFDHVKSIYTTSFIIEIPQDTKDISENKYGLFLGRSSNERLYAFWKHMNWKNKNLGLATFHFNPIEDYEFDSEYVEFLIQHSSKWKDIQQKLPYSDFNNYLKPPIVHESHRESNFWKSVYEKISIEIICETVVHNESFFVTEKTIRPILYKRFFVTIASKGFEKRLKELGFDIFDDIIDKTYDNKSYYDRIEHVYGSLDHVLRNLTEIKQSADIKQRLEKNRQKMIEYLIKQENQHKLNLY